MQNIMANQIPMSVSLQSRLQSVMAQTSAHKREHTGKRPVLQGTRACMRAYPEKEKEEMAVALANRVANPGAEVIKCLDAAVRDGAVLRAQGTHDLATHAQLTPVAGPKSRRIKLPVNTDASISSGT